MKQAGIEKLNVFRFLLFSSFRVAQQYIVCVRRYCYLEYNKAIRVGELILCITLLKYVNALSDSVCWELRTVSKFYVQQAVATVLGLKCPLMLSDSVSHVCRKEGMCALLRSR
jgi:hypothetical protein